MKNDLLRGSVLFLVVGLLTAAWGEGTFATSTPGNGITGSKRCAPCHQIQYRGWVNTFHSTVIKDAKKDPSVILGDMARRDLPFNRGDIDLTIGGHWDQRYLKKIGDDYYVLPRLWSIQSRKWRPYSTYGWERRPYSKYCVGCHSVGFDPATKSIREHAVGCESCHGMGEEHIAGPAAGNIVNPSRLSKEQAADICSSCHVRGKDLSGEYYFPIGFSPGEDLSRYINVLEKRDGETNREAINRSWKKWLDDREAQARTRCEVCGIHQNPKPKGATSSVDQVCMGCHEYDDQLSKHTHHKAETQIGCSDCHVQKNPELNETRERDVHSYSYFLIHPQNCWDREIYKRCGSCHTEETEQWAYDTFMSWKKPVVVDH